MKDQVPNIKMSRGIKGASSSWAPYFTGTLFFFSLIFGFQTAVFAAFGVEDVGTTSGQFLKIGAGARAEGMGGAYGAVAEDATTLYWNPAGLARLNYKSVSFTHAAYVDSMAHDYVSMAFPVGKNFGVGSSLQFLSVGDVETSDDTGLRTGSIAPSDMATSFGLSYKMRRWAVGSTVKYIRSTLKDTATTLSTDLGVHYSFNRLSIGFSAQNLTGSLKYDQAVESLPLTYRFAGAYRFKKVLFAMDANMAKDNRMELATGFERYFELSNQWKIALRGGLNSRTQLRGLSRPQSLLDLKNITAGWGTLIRSVALDYAWVPLGDLGQTHRLSLSLRFGSKRK